MENSFIYETSNRRKIKVFFLTLLTLIILGIIGYFFQVYAYAHIRNTFLVNFIITSITHNISTFTPLGIFYIAFIGTNVFIPMPMEFIFYYALLHGGSPLLFFILVVIGITASQMINYWLGLKCSPLLNNFLPTQKLYHARRIVNKWGAYGILFTSLVPAPSEVVTFGLGLTRYNLKKLLFFNILGTALKYAAIIGIFLMLK